MAKVGRRDVLRAAVFGLAAAAVGSPARGQVCSVCGYTLEGQPPGTCPICGASFKAFRKFQ